MYPEIDVMLLLSDDVNFLFLNSKKNNDLDPFFNAIFAKKFPCEIQSIKINISQSVTEYFVLSVTFTMNIINYIFCNFTGCPKFLMMASQMISQGHEAVECGLCQNPVSFFCRRCGVNLCDSCIPVHLRVKSKFGHDVVNYASKDDDDDVSFCY